MEIDQITLAAMLGIKSLIASVIFYLLHISARNISGIKLWSLASLSLALAIIIDTFDIVKHPGFSYFLFNTSLVSSQVFFLFGTAQFVKRPFRRGMLTALLLLIAIATIMFALVFPSGQARALALTPIFAGANCWTAWLLLNHRMSKAKIAYYIAAATMLLQAGAAVAHALFVVNMVDDIPPTVWWTYPATILILINSVSMIALGSWSLFLLIVLRLLDELKTVTIREERERIARDLHDTVLQTFQGFVMKVNAMLPDSESALGDSLNRSLRDAITAIQEGREKISALRTGAGQISCLHEYLRMVGEMEAGPGQHLILRCEGTPRQLHARVQQELCAIGQEAIRNAFRHSCARHHETIIEYGATALALTIQDDGRGIHVDDRDKIGHWGLRGIEQRARLIHADAVLHTASCAGTKWHIKIKAATAYADT